MSVAKVLKKLDRWQQEGLQWMQNAETQSCGHVLADHMGSGKTHQACALVAVKPLAKPTLIICPSANIAFWRDAVEWIVGHRPYMAIPGCSAHIGIRNESIIVATQSLFRTPPEQSMVSSLLASRLTEEIEWGRVFVDEAHLVLKLDTMSRQKLDTIRADFKWAICGCAKDGSLPRSYADVISWTGANEDRDVLRRLPPTPVINSLTCEVVRIDFASNAEKEMYQKIHEVAVAHKACTESRLRCRQFAACPMAFKMAVQRQAAFGAKKTPQSQAFAELLKSSSAEDVPWALGTKTLHICNIIKAGLANDKFIIFCDFKAQVDNILGALRDMGIGACALTGSMSVVQQSATVAAFGSDGAEFHVLVAMLQIGTTGLNLHTASRVILATSQTADPFLELQAASRVDRKGQDKIPQIVKIIIRGTVEDTGKL